MLRVCTLFHFVLSAPLRFLTGKSRSLNDWSIARAGELLDITENFLQQVAADGRVLLDEETDPFASVAASQPVFAAWRTERLEREVKAADGTKHRAYARAFAEARAHFGSID